MYKKIQKGEYYGSMQLNEPGVGKEFQPSKYTRLCSELVTAYKCFICTGPFGSICTPSVLQAGMGQFRPPLTLTVYKWNQTDPNGTLPELRGDVDI